MNPSAHLDATQSLSDFRAALVTFSDQAKGILDSVSLELRRTEEWLTEQFATWKLLKRRAEDEVLRCKSELTRRRLVHIGDRSPDCTEQEEALADAEKRLEEIVGKLTATRRWLRELPQATLEYDGPARQLRFLLEADVPKMISFLDRSGESLDGYLRIRPGTK